MYSSCMLRVASVFVVILAATAAFPVNPQRTFKQITKEADAARGADRLSDAIRLYQQGLRLRPSWSEGWWSLGSVLYDQDRFREAEAAFLHFVAITPKPGPAFAFLGLCEYE